MRYFTLPEERISGQCCPMTFPLEKSLGYFREQKNSDLWPRIDKKLGQEVGEADARHKEEVKVGMIDSLAVKTAEKEGRP